MSREQIVAAVEAHTCVIDGVTYRFAVESTAIESVEATASARILLHAHAEADQDGNSRPVARLNVMAPVSEAAEIPLLITDALYASLQRSTFDPRDASVMQSGQRGDDQN